MAGPTSFAPIIDMAMTIVEKSGGQYHVLLIIADGQVIYFAGGNLVSVSRYIKLNVKVAFKFKNMCAMMVNCSLPGI